MVRAQIIQVIKNTFELEDDTDLQVVASMSEAAPFHMLPALLSCLTNEYCTPKELAQTLELVVINIKMKTEQTSKEQAFLKQVSELIDKPLYIAEPHHEHPSSSPTSRR